MHSWWRVHIHYNPSISSIVHHANELWLSPNFPRLCWLSAILQTCQPSHFWRNCPTFWACKVKKRNSPTFLKFQWWQISLYEQQRMMSILHGSFYFSIFTSLYCDKFSYENPSLNPESPEPQLCEFFWFLVMHMHTVLPQCYTYFTLVGWQVCNNFVSN